MNDHDRDSSCTCGHAEEYHDPRLPGCAECTCREWRDLAHLAHRPEFDALHRHHGLDPVRVHPGGPRPRAQKDDYEWVAALRDALPETDVYTEWAVDCRDQPARFASILTFQSKGDACAYAHETGRPVLERKTVISRRVGEWELAEGQP